MPEKEGFTSDKYREQILETRALQPANERPGLATGWGANKASSIRPIDFDRDTESMDTIVVFYNNKEGAEAMKRSKVGLFDKSYKAYGQRWRNRINVVLENRYGMPLPHVMAQRKPVFLGKKGQPYTVVIENIKDERIEVVISVDGLDVMDGKTASIDKRGYIIGPKDTLRVEGFRRSLSEVAQFEFSSVGGSYANLTGGETAARNVGVIGVASFRERESDESVQRKAAEAFPGGGFAKPPTR